MNITRYIFLPVLFLLIFGLSDLHAQATLHSKLDQYLNQIASGKGFSGAVLVARGHKILLDQGYGYADLKRTKRVKSETKFYIASITKQFTASAILILEEQGLLSVNDPISKYLKDVPEDKSGITIHQLLTHTSGIGQNYAADGVVDRSAAIKAILERAIEEFDRRKVRLQQ